jgi:hypothetical protein
MMHAIKLWRSIILGIQEHIAGEQCQLLSGSHPALPFHMDKGGSQRGKPRFLPDLPGYASFPSGGTLQAIALGENLHLTASLVSLVTFTKGLSDRPLETFGCNLFETYTNLTS